MTAEVVTGELHLDRIADKAVRDVLRQAVRMAGHGDTVWIINRAGERIGALVSVERANASLLVPVDEAEDVW